MPKYTQPKKTWFYPVDFKIKAVELSLRDDVLSKDVARSFHILASYYLPFNMVLVCH
jgi:transposase